MRSVVLLGGILSLFSMPAIAHRFNVRLSPRDWARLIGASLITGFALLEAALVLCALPVLAAVHGMEIRGHFFPGGLVAGWISLFFAVALPMAAAASMVRTLRRRSRLRVEPFLGRHFDREGVDVAVAPSDRLLALAVPGRSAQVVVSEGLLAAFDDDQVEIVIRHELSHIRNRHDRYLMLANGVRLWLSWLPGTRRTLDLLCLSLEEWADDDAARDQPRRSIIRTTLVALATADLGGVAALMAPERTVMERLASLEKDPTTSKRLTRVLMFGAAAAIQTIAALPLIRWM